MPDLSYLSPKTTVKESPIHGRGLFAIAPICQGELVAIKGGYIFTRQQWQDLDPRLGPADIPIADGFVIGPVSMAECEGGMIFSNHSCEPNLGVQGQIVFVALRDIQAGEELTHDWAMTDDETYEMVCHCGAPTCRGVVTGQDWRRKELQEKYGHYMSWYLLEKIKKMS
jgi:SET domain-containing protein